MGISQWMKTVLVPCFIISLMVGLVWSRQATAGSENEAKVTSQGGYTSLSSKAQSKGAVKVIVRIRIPFTPEPLLQEKGVDEQRSLNAQAQDRVIAELEGKGHRLGLLYKYKYTPFIAMTVDSATLDTLIASPDVISVEEDAPVPATLDQSVPRIGAAQLHAIGAKGSDVAVAVLDTGVDKTHPFLLGSVVSEACYSTNGTDIVSLCPGGVTESEAAGSAMPYGGACYAGGCDHGTHVAGIVAGRSGIVGSPGPGVAPEAGIIAIQVFSRFNSEADCGAGKAPCVMTYSSDLIKGLERVYELHTTYSIASVNMSLGGGQYTGYCDSDSRKPSVDTLRAAGIATVIASGNNGFCGAISAPACISTAISVGATDDADAVSLFSNSASFVSLLAPGQWITSSVPAGGYAEYQGTSMATPHVAGAWALIKQDSSAATVAEILASFTSTGLSVTDTLCPSMTKKRINVYEAFNLISVNATLSVSKAGKGKGAVTSDPSGIACGIDCSGSYAKGTEVTLTAVADTGSRLSSWTGCDSTTDNVCIVLVNQNRNIEATFELTNEGTYGTQITITDSGFGTKKGKVYIGGLAQKVDIWTPVSITFTVKKPPAATDTPYDVTIQPKEPKGTPPINPGAFTLRKPEIDPISPATGSPEDEITINGMWFGTKKGKIYIHDQKCKVKSWTMNPITGESSLVFEVNKKLGAGKYFLEVENKIGRSVSFGFEVK